MTEPDPLAVWRVVEEWLQLAQDDLRAIRACCAVEPPVAKVAAYLCQQAAEKVLKGFHVKAGVRIRKTHDLGALADVVASRFPHVATLALETEAWTDWNVVYRYPGEADMPQEPSIDALERAAEQIETLAAALRQLAP